MPFPVKICGITRLEDALLVQRFGAFAVGFVFHRRSPRFIQPERAGEISRLLGPSIARVGVFVDEDYASVLDTVRTAGLTAVQLHGGEDAGYIRALRGIQVIKAFRVGADFDPGLLGEFPADYFLLDTYVEGSHGGTGKTFDWALAAPCAAYGRIILAGGLRPGNVGEAIRKARPWGVDVSSGVERGPGIKDENTMSALFEATGRITSENI